MMYLPTTKRLNKRSLRLPTRTCAQTGQAGADPGIFVCRSKFPGLKGGWVLISKYIIKIEHIEQKELFFQQHSF